MSYPPPQYPRPYSYPSPQRRGPHGLSLAAVIVAGIAIVLGLVPFLGLVVGIVGFGLAAAALIVTTRNGQTRALAGIALGLATLAVAIGLLVTAAILSAVNNVDTSTPRPVAPPPTATATRTTPPG